MTITLIGYARCSIDKQDLAAQKAALEKLCVAAERIYTDHGLTGTNRSQPGLDQALAAVRTGNTLVVPKLDRLARSVPNTLGHRLALSHQNLDLPQLGDDLLRLAMLARHPSPFRAPTEVSSLAEHF